MRPMSFFGAQAIRVVSIPFSGSSFEHKFITIGKWQRSLIRVHSHSSQIVGAVSGDFLCTTVALNLMPAQPAKLFVNDYYCDRL